jgi:hypothetical protein
MTTVNLPHCAECGVPIARVGDYWMHVKMQVPPHAARPAETFAVTEHSTTYGAEALRLLLERITWLEGENAALRAALENERDAPLVAAALAWLPEHAEYTAGCATCEALVEAARAHRAAVDGDTEGA